MKLTIDAPTLPVAKFPSGTIVLTANAAAKLDTFVVHEGLRRHACGDWGELCPEDTLANDAALRGSGRLFSAYGKGKHRFWIITEADRSVTTVLMAEDY
jgi:hypothetical protein